MILRRWSVLVLATLTITILADRLLFLHRFGWNIAIFLAAAAAFAAAKGGAGRSSAAARLAGAALLGLLVALAIQPGPLVFLMTMTALASFTTLLREGAAVDASDLLQRLFLVGWRSPFRGLLDSRLLLRIFRRRAPSLSAGSIAKPFLNWTLPLAGSALFLGLFSVANPVLARELQSWSDRLSALFRWQVEPGRVVFWVLAGSCAWALLRVRARGGRLAPAGPAPLAALSDSRAALLLRCLALFNVVFAVQTLMDATYLFGGLHLPDGLTYAEYAHRGSYPLVATALLAAAFVLIAYRPGPATRETASVRRLVLFWIAQNIFLTFTAAWRLHLYTNVYSLTRLRVAAGIWMLLVAVGLAWIGLRIAGGKSNRWLVNSNLATTAIVLYLCCFVNFDGMIAWSNVRHCRETGGQGYYLDYGYLGQLGPESLPALYWMKQRGLYHPHYDVIRVLQGELRLNMADWHGWSYRSWMLWDGALE